VIPSVEVALIDPLPALRRGLAACLAAEGFTPAEPEDAAEWASTPRAGVLVLALLDDGHLTGLAGLRRQHPKLPIVGLVGEDAPGAYQAALAGGATTAASRADEPSHVIQAVRAAFDGYCLLPAGIVRKLAINPPAMRPLSVTEEEVGWLATLARGVTIGEMAADVGFSQREMFRRLRAMYDRMGVAGRQEAVVAAAVAGVVKLDDRPWA
jgi:DNA-binding NarL/FixJ family response regulator